MMTDDAQLLLRFVEARSQPDFTALVERHLNGFAQIGVEAADHKGFVEERRPLWITRGQPTSPALA